MFLNRSPRGVTLMEIIIASTVFSMVIGISFVVTLKSTNSFHQQIQEGTLVDKSEKVLKGLQDELSEASLMTGLPPAMSANFYMWNFGLPGDCESIYYFSTNNGPAFFRSAAIRFKVPMRYRNPTTNPMGYTVYMNPVSVQMVNGVAINAPTFPKDPNLANDPGADFDFRLRYGWRDTARYVGNADDGDAMVPLQGPGLRLGTTGNAVPSGVDAATSSFTDGGVTYPSGTLKGGYMCIYFRPDDTRQIGKFGETGMFNEALEDYDLDGDGLKTNTFVVGHLERCYFVGDPPYPQMITESRQVIGDQVMLQPRYPSSGTAPDQLASNRIFSRDTNNAARLNVNMWLMTMTADGLPHLIQSKISIFMRNNANYVTATSATGTN